MTLEEIAKSANHYNAMHERGLHLLQYMGIGDKAGKKIWEREKCRFREDKRIKTFIIGSFFDEKPKSFYITNMGLEALYCHNEIFRHVRPYMIDKLEKWRN